jgi:hypothetical protein
MSRADTYRFLCGCLSEHLSDPQREMFHRAACTGVLDWTDFIIMASESLVAPSLLAAGRANGLAELLPREVMDYLDGMAILNRQRNRRIQSEITEIAAVFAQIAVAPVLLKGAAHLMSGLYDDIGDRVMSDVDLLVPDARLHSCAEALQREGFRILADNGFPAHHHYPPLGRPGDSVSIELHVEALDAPHARLLQSAEIFATSARLSNDARLALPSPQTRLIIAVAHAQLSNHGYLYGELGLRELLDFGRLCRRHAGEIDWIDLIRRFKSWNAQTALACHFVAGRELLGIPVPPELRVNSLAGVLHALAMWQIDYPQVGLIRTRLLRPSLQFRRSMSSALGRRRLLQNVRDPAWLSRHWLLLLGKRPS